MFEITDVQTNKDAIHSREWYLELDYSLRVERKLKDPIIETHMGRKVLRCDLVGSIKALAAEKWIASMKEDTVVYCAPRQGYAPYAVATIAKAYGKRAVFFAPASAEPTDHQLVVKALGGDLRFVRIAAMPVLNGYAKAWAEKHGAAFIPFGMSGVPEVTAGIVALADRLTEKYGAPSEFWCAVSTGTMTRGLQIGWPLARAMGVAVARNMHPGEIGKAILESATMPFLKACKVQPPFNTTAAYDAKAWEPCLRNGRPGSLFINVGADKVIADLAKTVDRNIDSVRTWGDFRDLGPIV
jgi:hypothetical protein